MRVSTPETCTAVYTYVINWIQSHLVGQLFNLIHDARTHEYKIIEEGAAIYSTSAWNHATPFSTAKNVSINKQLVCFQSASAFCLGLGRKRAKRHFFISNVSAGNILAVRCRWSGCYWTKQSDCSLVILRPITMCVLNWAECGSGRGLLSSYALGNQGHNVKSLGRICVRAEPWARKVANTMQCAKQQTATRGVSWNQDKNGAWAQFHNLQVRLL